MYRRADLAHLVRRSATVIAISERTRIDILDLFPEAESKVKVVHLGPGNVKPDSFSSGEAGTVLLVGRAKHKRNELAARAICLSRPPWAQKFIGLNVSDDVRSTLEVCFGRHNCEWRSVVDDATAESLYVRAAIFVNLSMEEGFGLPFVEALAAGCQVIAIRQTLTETLLDGDALLIEDGHTQLIAEQLAEIGRREWPTASQRRARADTYSWDATSALVESHLAAAAGLPARRSI
jgi:glycosyltransferase involved in cell wall biosynthesis